MVDRLNEKNGKDQFSASEMNGERILFYDLVSCSSRYSYLMSEITWIHSYEVFFFPSLEETLQMQSD